MDDLDAPDPSVERAAWQARVLRDLTEIGMSIARGMERRVLADRAAEIAAVERGQPLPERDGFDPGLAYSRLARAVRLNLTLMTRLDVEQDLAGFDTRPVAEIIARICRDLGVAVEAVVQAERPVGPLHHATRGPPPPRREELEWIGAEANSSPVGGGGPRSGGGGSPGPSP